MSKTRIVTAQGNPGPVRISHFQGRIAQSIHRAFYLGILPSSSVLYSFSSEGAGEGGGEPNNHGWEIDLVAGLIPEFNPYKPQVPESLIDIGDGGREIYDWLEEQQKTIRLQHNITQAGDTTFPYQMIINTHSERQFRLGAIGRFYHETYGVTLARYVQFDRMNSNITSTSPVGLLKKNGIVDWIVTNRLELSDPNLVIGVSAAYLTPADGVYGWVIVDGVNLQPLVNNGGSAVLGEAFVWNASGEVGTEGRGIVIGRRLNEGTTSTILRGQMKIRLEGLSKGGVLESLAELIAEVEQLQEDVANLTETNDVVAAIAAINTKIAQLVNGLATESAQRKAADNTINARIDNLDAVTLNTLNQAIAQINNAILTIQTDLQNQINATNVIAIEALEKANQALSINLGDIQNSITLILQMLADEALRPKGKFPVVDGSVPPQLVYLDDGTLVYTETF